MLHIVNRAPDAGRALADCLRVCDAASGIVLIEDGVYAAIASGAWLSRLRECTSRLYALDTDIAARGLAAKIDGAIEVIDTARFVALCCEYPRTYSWY